MMRLPGQRRSHLAGDPEDEDIAVQRGQVLDKRLVGLGEKGIQLGDVAESVRHPRGSGAGGSGMALPPVIRMSLFSR